MVKRMADTLPDGPLRSFLNRLPVKKGAASTTSLTDLQRALNKNKCPECSATSWRVLSTRPRKGTADLRRSCVCLRCGAIRGFVEKDGVISAEPNEADSIRERLAEAEAEIARLKGDKGPAADDPDAGEGSVAPNEEKPAKGKPAAKSARKKAKVEVAP